MAAPSNTVWGSVSSNGKGKLGIAVSTVDTKDTTVQLHIEIWLALRYNIDDSNNDFSFTYTDGNSPSGYSTINSSNLALHFGTTSGSGWADVSQQMIMDYYLDYTRISSPRTVGFEAVLSRLAGDSYSVSASATYIIPAVTHTVTYNANGGTGAPSSQTKVWGSILTLSSTKPTRTGHNFRIWNTAKNGSGTNYSPGQQYGDDVNVTLYAQWNPYTHIVAYNANGGTGAPSAQTKVYGSVLTLSNAIPTRPGYMFVGWYFDADGHGGRIKEPGSTYAYDQNGGTVTLIAQWEISNVAYVKQNDSFVPGNTYCKVNEQQRPGICYIKDDGIYKQSTL